jgi:hypothetical protein
VNRPEPDAGPDRETAARARLGQTCGSIAADVGITRARPGQICTAARETSSGYQMPATRHSGL